MAKRWTLIALVGLSLVAGVAVTSWADSDDDDEKVALDKIPAAARAALLKHAGDAKITEVEKETKRGVVLYEAEWVVDGREREATVTADGALVELEEELDAKDVPAAVKAAAAKKFGDAKVKYEKKMIILYEVEGKIDGKEHEILIKPTGKIMKYRGYKGYKGYKGSKKHKGHKKHEKEDDDDDDDD